MTDGHRIPQDGADMIRSITRRTAALERRGSGGSRRISGFTPWVPETNWAIPTAERIGHYRLDGDILDVNATITLAGGYTVPGGAAALIVSNLPYLPLGDPASTGGFGMLHATVMIPGVNIYILQGYVGGTTIDVGRMSDVNGYLNTLPGTIPLNTSSVFNINARYRTE